MCISVRVCVDACVRVCVCDWAGTDYGLEAVCRRAGLSWAEVAAALGDPQVEQQWRKITADNVEEIFANGEFARVFVCACVHVPVS